jgi:G3E family GTPase
LRLHAKKRDDRHPDPLTMPLLPRPSRPLTILSGYLGAGKTTVLNHLLRQAAGRRFAVIVNDFGSINIDADLIQNKTADTLSITGGCVCCTFGDDLLQTLQSLCDRPNPFDHLLIETSGVTLPGNLRASLSLIQGLQVVGTLVLVDAQAIRGQAADRHVGDTVRQQLQAADLLLLTKTDRVADDTVDALRHWLASLSRAPILPVIHGEAPLEVLLGTLEESAPAPAPVPATATGRGAGLLASVAASEVARNATDERPPGRIRAPHPRIPPYQTLSIELPDPVDPQALAQGLATLNPGLLRAKGFVCDAQGRRHTLQLVGPRASLEPAPATISGPGKLVTLRVGEQPTDADIHRTIAAATRSPAHPSRAPHP